MVEFFRILYSGPRVFSLDSLALTSLQKPMLDVNEQISGLEIETNIIAKCNQLLRVCSQKKSHCTFIFLITIIIIIEL